VDARSALFDLYGDHLRPRGARAARSRLVHEWRKFLFRDPGLPAELLPAAWAGHETAKVFDAESARLLPAASRFVECCLRPARDQDEARDR
jgi:phenylacetic acid degradation operon negative regulatory protein